MPDAKSIRPHEIVKPTKSGIRLTMRFLQEHLGVASGDHVLITLDGQHRTVGLQAFNPFHAHDAHMLPVIHDVDHDDGASSASNEGS